MLWSNYRSVNFWGRSYTDGISSASFCKLSFCWLLSRRFEKFTTAVFKCSASLNFMLTRWKRNLLVHSCRTKLKTCWLCIRELRLAGFGLPTHHLLSWWPSWLHQREKFRIATRHAQSFSGRKIPRVHRTYSNVFEAKLCLFIYYIPIKLMWKIVWFHTVQWVNWCTVCARPSPSTISTFNYNVQKVLRNETPKSGWCTVWHICLVM